MIRQWIPIALAVAALGLFGLSQKAAAADNMVIPAGCCPTGHSGCCDDGSHKVCRPTVENKDVPKRVYSSVCEHFCLPKCSCLGGLFGCSDCCAEDGACHDCEKPRTRKYLVLHIRHHEECVPKCVVENQCCPTPCCPAPFIGKPSGPGTPMPAPPAGAPKAVQPMPPGQPMTLKLN
jgi:hypothetical protein